jgi:hypothetical protein
MVDLQTEGVLISFRTLRCRLRYAQVQINISTRFSSNLGQQLPVICAWLEVRHGLSTITFDRGLVISPEFCNGKKRNKRGESSRYSTLWKSKDKVKKYFLGINGRIQDEQPCSLYFAVE